MNAIRNNIPNAITSLNLFFGCMACIMALTPSCFVATYRLAFLFIALSAVADFLDGLVARLLHAVSAIGKELDSLADLVSFGLAPALILYSMMNREDDLLAVFALLLPVFGALRLARFNVDTNQATTFTGLPIPANAIFWIGFTDWYDPHTCPMWIVLTLIVVLSLLMVCPLRMFSLKMHNLSSIKQNWAQYLQIVATVAAVIALGLPGLAVAIALYVLLSVIKREK
ncbi:MAG: CDP-diacylglycerol--serine O-phosphatidyltransferase [Muribaculaceae bacterium]|jgi:CDP-diacylglycerol--serine O-phosphatidyltransferase|nr:CDP-diacylglycerol--serine O-phosphatidyltransferase [Muribaculaceae bacterium]